MKRKLIPIILCLILALGLVTFYFNKVILPSHFKNFIVQGAGKILDRKITIGSLHFHWLKGFVATQVKVYEKDSTDKIFLSAANLSFSVSFNPGFKEQKIIIPFINLESPTINLVSSADNTWNFQDFPFIKRNADAKAVTNYFPVLLGNVTIKSGMVRISKQSATALWTEVFDQISLKASFSHKKGIQTQLSFRIPKKNGSFTFDGRYDLKQKVLAAKLNAYKIAVQEYLDLWAGAPAWLKLQGASIPKLELMLELTPQQAHMTGDLAIENLNWPIDEKRKVEGKLIAINKLDLTKTEDTTLLSGGFIIRGGGLKIEPQFALTTHLSGQITSAVLKGDHLSIQGDLLTQQTNARWLQTRSFQGDLTLRDISYFFSPQAHSVKLNGTSKNTRFEMQDRFVIQGDAGAQRMEINLASLDNIIIKGLVQVQNGSWQWDNQQKLTGNAIAKDFHLNVLNRKNSHAQTDITLEHGLLILSSDRRVSASGASQNMTFHWENEILNVQGAAKFDNGIFVIDDQLTYQGNPLMTLDLQYNSVTGAPTDFKATAEMSQASLRGLPIGDLKDIRGILHIEPNAASSKELRATFLNSDARLRGRVDNFNNPTLEIHAELNRILLEDFMSLIPKEFTERVALNLSGPADLAAQIKGPFKNPQLRTVEAQTNLIDVKVNIPALDQSIEHLTGSLDYTPNLLSWKVLKGQLLGQEISLTGTLKDFTSPTIDTTLSSYNMNLTTQFNLLRHGLEFLTLKGQYYNTTFDVHGDLSFNTPPFPYIKALGMITLDLGDIGFIVPAARRWIAPLDIKGVVTLDTDWEGSPKDFRNLKLRLNGRSHHFSINGFEWTNAFLTYSQRDQEITQMDLEGDFHKGKFHLLSSVDLLKEEMPFNVSLRVENAEAAELAARTNLQDKLIYGNVSLDALLNGPLNNWRQLQGKGDVSITEGYLGEYALINGILKVMVISELKKFTLTDALFQWTISKERLITKNLRLISPELWLLGRGWIDFDKNINMGFQADFNTQLIDQSKSLKRFTTRPLAEFGEFVPVHCSGSLDQPACNPDPNPIKWLGNIGGKLIDGVESTLQGF